MKKCALIFIVCVLIAACGKKKGATPIPAPPAFVDSPFVTASIGNLNFATDSATILSVAYPGDSAKLDVSLQAVKTIGGVGYMLLFYITNFTGVNTYAVAPPQVSITYYANGVRHYAQSGQIVVATDSNNIITGTFNFVADSLVATNGAFNVIL